MKDLENLVKDVGQSLINNAAKISQDYQYQTSLTISCELMEDNLPEIIVEAKYIPETTITRLYEVYKHND